MTATEQQQQQQQIPVATTSSPLAIILPRMANASPRLDTLRKMVELDAEYLSQYRPFYHCFLQPLQKFHADYGIDDSELSLLVNYMIGIIGLTKKVGIQLRERCLAWEDQRRTSEISISDIFDRDAAKYVVYGKYLRGFDRMMQWYALRLRCGGDSGGKIGDGGASSLRELWDRCEGRLLLRGGSGSGGDQTHRQHYEQLNKIGITAHFILPMRYVLRLRELWHQMLKLTPAHHPNRDCISAMVGRLDDITGPLLSAAGSESLPFQQHLRALSLQESLSAGTSAEHNYQQQQQQQQQQLVLQPGRRLIGGGAVYRLNRGALSCTTSLVNLHLFSDLLVLAEDPTLDHSGHKRLFAARHRHQESTAGGDSSTPAANSLRFLHSIPLTGCWYHDPTATANCSTVETMFQLIQLTQNPVLNEDCDAFSSGIVVHTFIATSVPEKTHWYQQITHTIQQLTANSPSALRERQLIAADWRPFFNKGGGGGGSHYSSSAFDNNNTDSKTTTAISSDKTMLAGRVGSVFDRLFKSRRHSSSSSGSVSLGGSGGGGGGNVNALSKLFHRRLLADQLEL